MNGVEDSAADPAREPHARRHVVVVGHHLLPDTERQVEYLAATMGVWQALSRRGARVTRLVAVPDSETSASAHGLSTGELTVYPLSLRPRRPRVLARFPSLERTLQHLQPDIVHVVGEPWQRGIVSALKSGRRVGAHVGVHFAENGPALRGPGGRLRHRAATAGLAAADYAVGWSTGAADLAKTDWGVGGPVRAFPSVGIPPVFFEAIPAHWEQRRTRIAFVGRLSPEKGIVDLLDLAEHLAGDGIGCTVVGDGPLRHLVEAAARDGLVEYAGALPRPDVAGVMASAAVTVVPSHPGAMPGPLGLKAPCEEQFGLVIAESLATRTPVVGYRVGAIPDVVGPGGSIVTLGDVPAMAAAVRRFLDDEGLWRTASEQGRRWAGQFADDRIADQLIRIWAELD